MQEISVMPAYLAKKTVESYNKNNLPKCLKNISQDSDPETLFMTKKQEDRLSLFNSLKKETQINVLERFWPDLSIKEQSLFLSDWCATSSPKNHALLFLLLVENHNLPEETIITIFEKLVLENVDTLTPSELADTFSQRLPTHIFETHAKLVMNKLKTVEQKLVFLRGIWTMLPLESKKTLFETVCSEIDNTIDPKELTPFISSFPPITAYKQFEKLLTIYTDPENINLLITAVGSAFKNASPDDLTGCALKILKTTQSARAAIIFILSGPQKYSLFHILELANNIIKSPNFSDLTYDMLFIFCSPFLLTGNVDTIISGLRQLEKNEACLYELLTKLNERSTISLAKRAEMIRIYLNSPDAPNTKKCSLIANYLLGHRPKYEKTDTRFYTFSKLLKDEICELLSEDFEKTEQLQLKTIWDHTDTKTQVDYFGYMTEKNRALLSLTPVPENIATTIKNRSAKELMPIIANLPAELFEPCYQKFDANTKIELFNKLLAAKKGWTLLEHIKERKELAFYGKNFPNILTIDSPLRLFLYPKKEDSEHFLEDSDIPVSFIGTIQNYKNMLTENEKKIIWSKFFNADFYSIFFPPLTAQEAFDLLKQGKK